MPKRVRTALFGVYSRYTAAHYLQYTTVTLIGLLTVALAIDLSEWLSRLMAHPRAGGGFHTVLFVGRYVLLRCADIVGRLLPFACFLGVLWYEIVAIMSRQRITIWVTGRSTLQCLVPVLALGLVAGVTQYSFETYLRPLAVRIQIDQNIGEFGKRFDRSNHVNSEWFFVGNDVVRARIGFNPSSMLQNLLLIRNDANGRLIDVVTADRAIRRSDGVWTLEAGMRLPVPRSQPTADLQLGAAPASIGSRLDQIVIDVDPVWLENFGIDAKYLPRRVLRGLATNPNPSYPVAEYRTWRAVREANMLAPLAMALLAATMSLVLLPHTVRFKGVLVIGLSGYFSMVAMRSLFSLGERSIVPPLVAAWGAIMVMISVSLLAIIVQRRNVVRVVTSHGR
jgi:lipopolysaccharide export LptBFGC system permease protein LptF